MAGQVVAALLPPSLLGPLWNLLALDPCGQSEGRTFAVVAAWTLVESYDLDPVLRVGW